MQKAFCDTNVLMSHSQEIFEKYDCIIISGQVLNELDKHKTSINEEKKYQARRASHDIENNESKVKYEIREGSYSLPLSFDNANPDNRIISVLKDLYSYDNEIIALSNDLLFREKCKSLDIPCEKFGGNETYKGYKTLQGGTYFINKLFDDIENGINDYQFVINEYLILYNSDTGRVSEHRYNGDKFVDLKLPDSKVIKGKNSLQRCVLDLLNNKDIPISVIQGCIGSGKTYLAIRMGLHHVLDKGSQSKVLGVREPTGRGKNIGFLPGNFEEKTNIFFKPLEQSLKGGEQELTNLVDDGVLEMNIPYYIKGTTYNNTFIIVDESSDLAMDQLISIGGRLGENSKIAFVGDYRQSVYNTSTNNALVNLVNDLKGDPSFGTITLEEDVRSNASKIFAKLMNKYH